MGKFDKIVSLMMSGCTDSAADAFVDNAFNQVLKNQRRVLREGQFGISTEHLEMLQNMDTDDIDMMIKHFDNYADNNGVLDASRLVDVLKKKGINLPNNEDYLQDVWNALYDEMNERGEQVDDYDDMNDLRDYDEEDRLAAWDDRYQAFKNEY